MLVVHKFGPAFGLPDSSPFVTKLETYLRLTGQKYETVNADIRKAPRKQLPCLLIDGKVIPDSNAIVEHLEGLRSEQLDAHLNPKERAIAHAFKSMLEEHLYFGLLFMRWATEDGWAVFGPDLRGMLARMGVPALMTGFVAKSARKQTVGRAHTQGVGRQSRAEVVQNCTRILDSLSAQLGDKPYFCGDKPTTYDATVYAFVSGFLCPAFDNEVHKHAKTLPNLVAYADRIKKEYWNNPAGPS